MTTEDPKRSMRQGEPVRRKVLVCHPDNLKALQASFLKRSANLDGYEMQPAVEIRTSYIIPRFVRKWVFPKERFWKYEAKDEVWCRYFGIGHEEETDELLFYMMDAEPPPTYFKADFSYLYYVPPNPAFITSLGA